MDNAVKLGVHFMRTLEKLKELGDENNEQFPSNSSIEKYVQYEICALLDAEDSLGEFFMKTMKFGMPEEMHDEYDRLVQFSGSLVEGAMMARCFQLKEGWNELEVDIMLNNFIFPQEVSHLLETVEEKPGFVRLPFCQELFPDFYTDIAKALSGSSEDVPHSSDQMPHYLNPCIVKDCFVQCAITSQMNSIVRSFFRDVFQDKITTSKTETTAEQKIDCSNKILCVPLCHVSIDFVPAICLLFWPHQAAAWINRHRHWPHQNTIQCIADKGCHVVPRSSPGGDVDSEWRLSFSGS